MSSSSSYTPKSIRTFIFSKSAVTIVRDFFPMDIVPGSRPLSAEEQYKYRMSHGNRGVALTKDACILPTRVWKEEEKKPDGSSPPLPLALYAIFLLDLWSIQNAELQEMVTAFFIQAFPYLLPPSCRSLASAARCSDEHVAYCVTHRLPLLAPSARARRVKQLANFTNLIRC